MIHVTKIISNDVYIIITKGVVMSREMSAYHLFLGPRTNKVMGTFGLLGIAAFIIMLLVLYAPELKTIGEGAGLSYNLVP